jgi:hypothetical protein
VRSRLGNFEDVIAFEGNALEDIKQLESVKFVMKGGVVVRNDLARYLKDDWSVALLTGELERCQAFARRGDRAVNIGVGVRCGNE